MTTALFILNGNQNMLYTDALYESTLNMNIHIGN